MEAPVCKSTKYYREHKEVLNGLARERHRRRYARQKVEAALQELKTLRDRLDTAIADTEARLATLQPRKPGKRDIPVIVPLEETHLDAAFQNNV